MRVPVAVHDADKIAEQVLVRPGAPGEGYPGIGRHRVSVEGRLVLSDREGPFGSLTGDALRTRVTTATRRALVVLFLPAGVDRGGADPLLEGVSKAVRQHCGGAEAGRVIAG
jgi:DNA/RNA-binding domain of Phe-tRNA-synthetase-like protein